MKKTPTIAYMNHGRWLHNCTKCGAVLPVDKDICPICHPDVMAVAFQQRPDKLFIPVPDMEKREPARKRAEALGELYKPYFPKQRGLIEKILRMRHRQHMNWEPGESVEFLMADNVEHGDPLPKEINHGL